MASALVSTRLQLARFLEGIDDPDARVVRGGRLAALGFITGGLTSIPVNLLVSGTSPYELLIGTFVLAIGVASLVMRWERRSPRWLYAIAVLAVLIIAAATVFSTLAYAINYIFVALSVALVAPFRVMLGAVLLITIGLMVPALVGPHAGTTSFSFAVISAPTLLVVSMLTFQLTRMLEQSRQAFWDLSRQDALTGIGNYRAMKDRLGEEISRHARHQRQLTVVVLDLDGFKQVNDDLGHLFGDEVLGQVARALRDSVRNEDAVFRQGGDEFAVIAPETGPGEIQPIVERVRVRVQDCAPDQVKLSIGTGIASYPDDGDSIDDLLGLADVRLMEGKRIRRLAPDPLRS